MNEVPENKELSTFQEGIMGFYAITHLFDGFILRLVPQADSVQKHCKCLVASGCSCCGVVTVCLAKAGAHEEWRNRPFEPMRSYSY